MSGWQKVASFPIDKDFSPKYPMSNSAVFTRHSFVENKQVTAMKTILYRDGDYNPFSLQEESDIPVIEIIYDDNLENINIHIDYNTMEYDKLYKSRLLHDNRFRGIIMRQNNTVDHYMEI